MSGEPCAGLSFLHEQHKPNVVASSGLMICFPAGRCHSKELHQRALLLGDMSESGHIATKLLGMVFFFPGAVLSIGLV